MDNLKPCPFCGGTAKLFVKIYSAKGTMRGWEFGVYCTGCDIVSPRTDYKLELNLESDGKLLFAQDDRRQAIEAWNRRADNG